MTAIPDDLGLLIHRIINIIRQQHAGVEADVEAAQQLVYSGAVGGGRRELAVQILVDRHVHRAAAEEIVDEIMSVSSTSLPQPPDSLSIDTDDRPGCDYESPPSMRTVYHG